MRCLNCLTVCNAADSTCPGCNKPLVLGRRSRSSGFRVSKYALICMVVGEAFFNTYGRRWFPSTGNDINMEFVMWAGVVGAGCAVVGAFLDMMLGGPSGAK